MFREFKISTGLNALLGVFIAFIVVVASFSLVNSFSTTRNFNDVVVTTENVDALNTAVVSLSNGLVRVNSLMLNKSLSRSVDSNDIADARGDFNRAKEAMNDFMRIPFNTREESRRATEVKKYFDHVLEEATNKVSYIADPASYPDNADKESAEQKTLRDKANDYLALAGRLNQQYVQKAQADSRRMMMISVVVLILSVLGMILARLWLKRTIFRRLEQAKMTFQVIATGDLSQEVMVGARNEIGLMLAELEAMRQSLTRTVLGIREGVTQIYSNVREIASSNNDLSSRTEEQASALQQTAASMEELKITVRQNADNAHSAKQLAESASTSAKKGGTVMMNLEGIMRDITENSRQIADINSVIDGIANQTNILALNAAVEAARAGEQGRGFAVVAGEVRNLAKRSADAAKEIRLLINTCVVNMTTGSQEVENAGTSMNEIVTSVIQVTDIMAEITSASDEQSTGINQIAQAVNEMDLVTQQNAAMVEQAAKTAGSVEEHVGNLDQQVAQFTLQDGPRMRSNSRRRVRVNEDVTPPIRKESGVVASGALDDEQWETF